MKKYFIISNGETKGPYDLSELKLLNIKSDTLVWNSTLDNWVKANEVEELNDLFKYSPPPIPSESVMPPPIDVNIKITKSPEEILRAKKASTTLSKEITIIFKLIILSVILALVVYLVLIVYYSSNVKTLKMEYASNEDIYNSEKEKNDNLKQATDRKIKTLFENISELKNEESLYYYLFPDEYPKDENSEFEDVIPRLSEEDFIKAQNMGTMGYNPENDSETLIPKKYNYGQNILLNNGISKQELTFYNSYPLSIEEGKHIRSIEFFNKKILDNSSREIEFAKSDLKNEPNEYLLQIWIWITIVLIVGRYIIFSVKWVNNNNK